MELVECNDMGIMKIDCLNGNQKGGGSENN
jgi:hypothetical protein